jgi:bifunctional non-homologous end joining protein LigD
MKNSRRQSADLSQFGRLAEYNRKRRFAVTPEPAGKPGRVKRQRLEFVVQKHRASRLHYDFRLEHDGVMLSWAVPKGPSLDPANKRFAMQTEDHPIEYNQFEGVIPEGQYGGGTVMIWDRGVYFADEAAGDEDEQEVLAREHAAGKMSFSFMGERLHGSYALVRTEGGAKPKWLLIKHRDRLVQPGVDPDDAHTTSIVTGRTLAEIGEEDATDGFEDAGISAMLYRYASELPGGRAWAFEPAVRGARVHIYVTPDAQRIVTALPGMARRYREVGGGLRDVAVANGCSFVLDGEIASDTDGVPVLHAFDLIFEDGAVLLDLAWTERRKRLEQLFRTIELPDARLVPSVRRGGKALLERAHAERWAGVVAKRTESTYHSGERTGDWIKHIFPGRAFQLA